VRHQLPSRQASANVTDVMNHTVTTEPTYAETVATCRMPEALEVLWMFTPDPVPIAVSTLMS
jgi:hypothetical protein